MQAILEVPKPYDRMLTIVAGQKWKDIRNTLTPTFSAHKMKQVGCTARLKLTYFFLVINFRKNNYDSLVRPILLGE